MGEAIEAMTDQAFAALAHRPRYVHDGLAQLQHYLRQKPEVRDLVVTRPDLVVTSAEAKQATAAQWAAVKEVQALPDGTVMLRVHRVA